MKAGYVLIAFILCSTYTAAQCEKYVSKEIDNVTGQTTIGSKENLVISDDGGKTGFGILVLDMERYVVVSIQAFGASRCIDEGNKINVLFRDGTRLELANQKDFNCQAEVAVYFGGIFGKTSEAKELAAKEIQIMRVWTSSGYVEKSFNPDQSGIFMNTFACLFNK